MEVDMGKIQSQQLAFQVQILDPDLALRTVRFISLISTWLIRIVDPKKSYPNSTVELPLPQEVPMTFRVLPEYFLEDVVDYFLFIVR